MRASETPCLRACRSLDDNEVGFEGLQVLCKAVAVSKSLESLRYRRTHGPQKRALAALRAETYSETWLAARPP